MKTPERRQWRRSGVFIVNFEHILDFGTYCYFEQVKVSFEPFQLT